MDRSDGAVLSKDFKIVTNNFLLEDIPPSDLVLCDPPYGLGKVYDGEKEDTPYASWVNLLEQRADAPWRLYFAPPLTSWNMNDLREQPHRIIYWCKTFVQLRRLNGWQYAVTPILVYKTQDAPWYGDPKKGHEHFDWITSPSPLADLRATRRYYSGGHPGVTGTAIARRIIRATTREGDLVVDPMCGLGSIPVAAISEGRRAHGIEVSNEYSRVARLWCMDTEATRRRLANSQSVSV